jgi:hypothetical protein
VVHTDDEEEEEEEEEEETKGDELSQAVRISLFDIPMRPVLCLICSSMNNQ